MRSTLSVKIKKLGKLYEQYERYLIPGALLFGVATDVLLFRTVNYEFVFLILGFHILISGAVIAFIHIYDVGYLRKKIFRFLRIFAPLILQYSFGALLSASLVFYWFSSAFIAVWPFILVIVALMLSNDLLRKYYLLLKVKIGVYFFSIFSYSVIVLPFVLKRIGQEVFIIGGLLSLVFVAVYLFLISYFLREIRKNLISFVSIILIIFLFFNASYFFNFIPPVPLSLREAEMAYSVERKNNQYHLLQEDVGFVKNLLPIERYNMTEGSAVHFFSSIFAPVGFQIDVAHHWQYYDKSRSRWVTSNKVKFQITGGRDGGYRGYSFARNVHEGRWRVLVETANGQVIGKKNFRINFVDKDPELKLEIY